MQNRFLISLSIPSLKNYNIKAYVTASHEIRNLSHAKVIISNETKLSGYVNRGVVKIPYPLTGCKISIYPIEKHILAKI